MKKTITKFIVILLVVSFSLSTFTGCTMTDKLSLIDSMEKMINISSMESDSDITLRIGVSGLTEAQRNELGAGIPTNESINMKIHQKAWGNSEGINTKSQLDAAVLAGGKTTSFSMWSESNIMSEIPVVRQIIKLPPELMEFLPPNYADRRYMVLDQAEMTSGGPVDAAEYRKMLEAVNRLQPRLINFMKEYAKEFNPDFAIITKKGVETIKGQDLTVYEVKLTDKTLKDLMRYALDNASGSENLKLFIKELVGLMMTTAGRTGTGTDMDEILADMKSGAADLKQGLNKVMNVLEKVRLLGDRGIIINLGIDDNGYMVNQNGFMDFVVDIKAIEAAFMDLEGTAEGTLPDLSVPNMIIDLGLDFNTDTYNINKDIIIDFPTLTPENSFSFKELIEEFGMGTDITDGEEDTVGVIIDNEWTEISPLMLGELALAPVEEMSKALGAQVTLENGIARVSKNGKSIIFTEGETNAIVDGKAVEIEFPAGQIMDYYYVPLEFLVVNLGAEIHYNEVGNIVIKTK